MPKNGKEFSLMKKNRFLTHMTALLLVLVCIVARQDF